VELFTLPIWASRLWAQAQEIWMSGGWAMFAIAAVALVMFAFGVHIWLGLQRTGFGAVPEETWRRWIAHPLEREGRIGEMLDFVEGGRDLQETTHLFEQLVAAETAPFERDLKVMKTCVSAAPLFGLLGTVTGMLATFGALAVGSGGDKTMAMIAKGISEALITTETGLVIALPGLFMQYQLQRKYERFGAFLTHLESIYTQRVHFRERDETQREARRAAAREIARTLARRIAGAPATTSTTTT
jgi:biopolymer transport protein ExbB